MGKKKKMHRGVAAEAEGGMSRSLRRELLELCNQLLEKCSQPPRAAGPDIGEHCQIRELVERIRKKQMGHVLPHKKREGEFDSFLQWTKEHGVDTSCVKIKHFETGGFGLVATKDIKMAEKFLQIPRSMMVSTETAQESVLGPLMKQDKILQSMPNISLALHVLCEKSNPESTWAPYINILPASYDTPLYYTLEEIQHLKGSPVLVDVLNQYKSIARQYSYFFKLFQGYTDSKLPIKNFCYDDYRWAVSTVMTRQNQIPSKANKEPIQALIPMWDMCNHANGRLSTDFNDEEQRSECFAFKDIKEGEQIHIFYGVRSNAEFLLHSGFVFPDNQWDRMSIKLGVSKNDSLYAMKAEALARLNLQPFHLHFSPVPVDSDLVAFLRIFHMNIEELKTRLMGSGSTDLLKDVHKLEEVVSIENEIRAWMFLQTRVLLLLKSYPTSLEEDEAMLNEAGVSDHMKTVVNLLICEKHILLRTAEYSGFKLKEYKKRLMGEEDDDDKDKTTDISDTGTSEELLSDDPMPEDDDSPCSQAVQEMGGQEPSQLVAHDASDTQVGTVTKEAKVDVVPCTPNSESSKDTGKEAKVDAVPCTPDSESSKDTGKEEKTVSSVDLQSKPTVEGAAAQLGDCSISKQEQTGGD